MTTDAPPPRRYPERRVNARRPSIALAALLMVLAGFVSVIAGIVMLMFGFGWALAVCVIGAGATTWIITRPEIDG